MLPQHHVKEGAFVAPKFELVKKDVQCFVEELRKFHEGLVSRERIFSAIWSGNLAI